MVWTPVSLGGAPARKLSLAAADCRFTRALAKAKNELRELSGPSDAAAR